MTKLFQYGDPVIHNNSTFTYVGERNGRTILITRREEDLLTVEPEEIIRIFSKEEALEALAEKYQTQTSKITIR